MDVGGLALGQPLTTALIEDVAAHAALSCDPLSDNKGTAAYKRELVRGLVRRAFRIVSARLSGQADPTPTHTYYG